MPAFVTSVPKNTELAARLTPARDWRNPEKRLISSFVMGDVAKNDKSSRNRDQTLLSVCQIPFNSGSEADFKGRLGRKTEEFLRPGHIYNGGRWQILQLSFLLTAVTR
jgi:hypothetical protein